MNLQETLWKILRSPDAQKPHMIFRPHWAKKTHIRPQLTNGEIGFNLAPHKILFTFYHRGIPTYYGWQPSSGDLDAKDWVYQKIEPDQKGDADGNCTKGDDS